MLERLGVWLRMPPLPATHTFSAHCPAAGKCLTTGANSTSFCDSMNSGEMYPGCEREGGCSCMHERGQGHEPGHP